MRIAYCTNIRFPNERAHGHQVAAVMRALAGLGHTVTLFAPFRRNPVTKNAHEYHLLPPSLTVRHLGGFDPIASPLFPGVLGLWTMNAMLRRAFSTIDFSSYDLLMTRSPAVLPSLLASGRPVVLELHALPRRSRSRFVRRCNRCVRVVCLTSPMAEELASWGVERERIIVEADGVDAQEPPSPEVRDALRGHFTIAPDTFVVGYAGSVTTMGLSKGVEQITAAVARLRKQGRNVVALIAGGPADAAAALRRESGDGSHFAGELPHRDIPSFLAACDALVYPAPRSNHPYFLRDTSPLKIFEYMAAERAIIAADLPPIHDVLDESSALFYEPGNSEELAQCIEALLSQPDLRVSLSQEAYKRAARHTWDKRMRRILDSLGGVIHDVEPRA